MHRAIAWVLELVMVALVAWSCSNEGDGGANGEAGAGGASGEAGAETGGTNAGRGGTNAGRGGRAGDGGAGDAGDAGDGNSGRAGAGGTGRGGSNAGTAGVSGAGAVGGESAGAGGADGGSGGGAGAYGGEGGETTGDDPCSPNPCANGGACRSSEGGAVCKCKIGFSGERCENDDGIRFASFDSSDTHWCGILEDGRIECRGDNRYGQASPPPGRFTHLEVTREHTCALRDDGRILCFGSDEYGATAAPSGTFTHVSTKHSASCGLRTDGSVVCWGRTSPPTLAGTFTEVSVGTNVCGIRTDGTLACAGSVPTAFYPTAGSYRHLSVGLWNVCAIDGAGQVVCWGGDYDRAGIHIVPVGGGFESVSVGDFESGYACGLRSDRTILCWQVTGGSVAPPGDFGVRTSTHSASFDAVSVSEERTCAIRTDGLVVCNATGDPQVPSGSFLEVAATASGVSGIRTDRSGVVYRNSGDFDFPPTERPGPFAQLSGNGLSYGLAPDGSFVSAYGEAVPSGTFIQADSGVTKLSNAIHTVCGVRSSGVLSCFGYDVEASPISGSVRQVTLSYKDGCALKTDGVLECWGNDGLGQATPPSGTYIDVSRGPNHGCAVRSTGRLACWGRNDDGESTPPAGRFVRVSTEGAHSCGIRESGELACWGANGAGQSSPPPGRFTRVSAGSHYTCALATDASIVCFGDRRDAFGNLPFSTWSN